MVLIYRKCTQKNEINIENSSTRDEDVTLKLSVIHIPNYSIHCLLLKKELGYSITINTASAENIVLQARGNILQRKQTALTMS